MPEELSAVMEAPDTGAMESTETTSTETPTGGEDSGAVDNNDTPQQGETGHLRGSELYRSVKDKLRNGEKLTSQEQRSIRNAIHIAAKADAATGGDLGKFESERATYEQLRGEGEESYTPEQMVEQIRSERQQLNSIFSDIQSGGEKLIEELITDSPEQFQNMAIRAFDRFASVNNEAFSTYVAKSAFGYLSSKQVPQQFTLLDRFLPQSSNDPGTQIVIDAVNAIKEALGGLGQMASKPLSMSKAPAQQNGNQNPQQDLQSREHNVRRGEWDQDARTPNRSLRDSEISKVAGSRKMQLTERERTQVLAAINEEYQTRLQASASYRNAMKGYVDANNRQAYMERASSEGKKLIPSIVQRHVNAVLDARPKASGAKPAVINKPRTVTTGTGGSDGTTWLAGYPTTLGFQVDYNKTTNRMLVNNQAYLKGKPGLFKWKDKV